MPFWVGILACILSIIYFVILMYMIRKRLWWHKDLVNGSVADSVYTIALCAMVILCMISIIILVFVLGAFATITFYWVSLWMPCIVVV